MFVADICDLAQRDFTAYLNHARLGPVELPPELRGLTAFP
jgi:hypothetical protein